jgi:hypothetical protein
MGAFSVSQNHLRVGVLAADPGIDRDLAALVEHGGDAIEFGVAGAHHGRGGMHRVGRAFVDLHGADVARHDQHRRAAPGEGGLGGQGGHSARLGWGVELLAEDAAAAVDRFEIDLLREVDAEFEAVDLARDQHHRRAVAMAFVEAVDEVQAAWAAAAGAGGEGAGHVGLGPGGQRAGLLVAHVHPFDVAAPDRIGDVVEGVADHPVASLDARRLQHVDNDVRDLALRHGEPPS